MAAYSGAPDISVIVPVFNGYRYLKTCLDSVLKQRFSRFELLIGDDHSTDPSLEIVRQINDPRIRVFRHSQNRGLFKNLNFLIQQVHSPLVRFLCQDDILKYDCLEAEARFFERYPNVSMAFCKSIVIDGDGAVIGEWVLGDLPEILPSPLAIQHYFYHGCIPGSLSTVSLRTVSLREAMGFDEAFRFSGDYDLWVRICQQGSLGVIHQRLVELRSHSGQLSRALDSTTYAIAETRRVRAKLLSLLPIKKRAFAKRYEVLRHEVFDAHIAWALLGRGHIVRFLAVVRAVGIVRFARATCLWILTADNRLYRPQPRFSP